MTFLAAGTPIAVKIRGQVQYVTLKRSVSFVEERRDSKGVWGRIQLGQHNVRVVANPRNPAEYTFKCQECDHRVRTGSHKCPSCGSYDIDVA